MPAPNSALAAAFGPHLTLCTTFTERLLRRIRILVTRLRHTSRDERRLRPNYWMRSAAGLVAQQPERRLPSRWSVSGGNVDTLPDRSVSDAFPTATYKARKSDPSCSLRHPLPLCSLLLQDSAETSNQLWPPPCTTPTSQPRLALPKSTMSARSSSRSPPLETCSNCAGAQVVDASFVDADKLIPRLTRILESSDFKCQYRQGNWYIHNAKRTLSPDDLTRLRL